MAQLTNERIIRNATASLEIEGFNGEDKYNFLCNKLLNKEITMSQYIEIVKKQQGINV